MLFQEQNLSLLRLTTFGNFIHVLTRKTWFYYYACAKCGYPFVDRRKEGAICCSKKCSNELEEYRRKISVIQSGKNNSFYGKVHSENTKRILAEKSGTYKHTKESKQKISNANKDKKRPDMVGENNHNYGNPLSNEVKRKLSMANLGKNNPNWKGGITCEPYCDLWLDKEYKYWIVYERDGRCYGPECNGKHVHKLMPHHINYDKKNCGPGNLIAVCISCNAKANYNRSWHQAWYTEIMRKRGIK